MTYRQNNLTTTRNLFATTRIAATGAMLAVLIGVTTTTAQAAVPLLFNGADTNYAESVQLSLDGGSTYQNVYAGQYSITLGSTGNTKTLDCFCVDYTNNISPGDTTTAQLNDITGANGLINANYNNAGNGHTLQQNANAVAYLVDKYLNSSVTKQAAAEVNVAIWDIVNDAGDTSKIKINNSAFNSDLSTSDISNYIADAYANNAANRVDWVQNPKISDNPDGKYQDFGIHGSDGQPYETPNANTPEPGVIQFAGVATAGAIGGMLRKFRNRARK